MVLSIDGLVGLLYQAVRGVYDYVKDVISNILLVFPFDNPKKTLMLSILIFFSVFLILDLFSGSGVLSGGVTEVTGDKKISISGLGDESLPSGGVGGLSTTTTLTSGGGLQCLTDNDCKFKTANEEWETACCLPEKYEGYACSGFCLRDFLPREACRLPNSCDVDISSVTNYLKTVPSSCLSPDIHPNRRTAYCRERSGSTAGYNPEGGCCEDVTSICYGMCLKDVDSPDCFAYTDCFEEKEVLVRAIDAFET